MPPAASIVRRGRARWPKTMAEIINLKSVKKARARVEKEREADANRAKFGRTKAERTLAEAEQDKRDRTLDGARIEETDD